MNVPGLTAYALKPAPPPLVPASPTRRWMDEFTDRHAYRCLPLSIANAHGWCVLSPCSFELSWTGGPMAEDITLRALDDFPGLDEFVQSHFTRGIVTFHTGYLFRTPPDWNLWVSGPANHIKDGAVPLSGLIETSWLPYPFTMNWHLTRPGKVRWERGEPFCMLFPVPASALYEIVPEIRTLESDPELREQCLAWRRDRNEFMARFWAGDEATVKQAWQRYYFHGRTALTGERVEEHTSKLRLHPPVDRRDEDSAEDAPLTTGDESG